MSDSRGLDLSRMTDMTPAEAEAFRQAYAQTFDRPHLGLNFWLDTHPETLKRYRHFATTMAANLEDDRITNGFPYLALYALTGFTDGVRYLVRGMQQRGLTRPEVLEGIAIAFLHVGPRGMETVAAALEDYPWVEPDQPPVYPAGWEPDPTRLASGLDFSSREVSERERELLLGWYERMLGEVPRYVTMLLRYRPDLLKAYRGRFENAVRLLPPQLVPCSLLGFNMVRGFREGIREDILLARGLGVSRAVIVTLIGRGMLYGGPEAASLVDEAAGDVLETWPD